MSSGEVLRHSVSIGEQEVFSLIPRPVELLELQPSHFVGRVASWAEYVERRYGDSINPVMTYVESGPHRVSWIYHEGEDWRSGERFCTYHIICDCIAGVEGNSPQESVDYNGEHRVSVLSTLFQLHPEVVKWYGRLLEESGVIEDFDGEILKLRPETLAA